MYLQGKEKNLFISGTELRRRDFPEQKAGRTVWFCCNQIYWFALWLGGDEILDYWIARRMGRKGKNKIKQAAQLSWWISHRIAASQKVYLKPSFQSFRLLWLSWRRKLWKLGLNEPLDWLESCEIFMQKCKNNWHPKEASRICVCQGAAQKNIFLQPRNCCCLGILWWLNSLCTFELLWVK